MSSYAALAVACLALGWLAGSGWARAARGWRDYRAHKAQLPKLLRLARTLSIEAAGFVALAVVVAALALYALTKDRG